MQLEVIKKAPGDEDAPARSTPLLFVHGAYSSAWIWTPFFQPFFARHGFTTYALSLRGHGRSEGRSRLPTTRLRDYLEDVERVACQIKPAPVLVGTSLGGVIIQHYLKRNRPPAAVLLASGPPSGMIPSTLRMALTNPWLMWDLTWMGLLGPAAATLSGTRRALFRHDTPSEHIRRFMPKAQPESALAMWDVSALDLPPSRPRRDLPVLVMGAGRDAFISPLAIEETARAFGVDPVIFPEMAHGMMLDQDWEQVALCMLEWLERVLPERAAA